MDYTIWEEVGAALKVNYPKRYVTPEQYLEDNPFEVLTVLPEITDFFGTKPLTLLIVSKPYGWSKDGGTWTENWPPDGFDEAKDRHKAMYSRFTKYKTHIWTDFYLVSLIMENAPESRFQEMMEAVEGHMQELCDDLVDYGFVYEGRIEEPKTAEFFKPQITDFFAQV